MVVIFNRPSLLFCCAKAGLVPKVFLFIYPSTRLTFSFFLLVPYRSYFSSLFCMGDIFIWFEKERRGGGGGGYQMSPLPHPHTWQWLRRPKPFFERPIWMGYCCACGRPRKKKTIAAFWKGERDFICINKKGLSNLLLLLLLFKENQRGSHTNMFSAQKTVLKMVEPTLLFPSFRLEKEKVGIKSVYFWAKRPRVSGRLVPARAAGPNFLLSRPTHTLPFPPFSP